MSHRFYCRACGKEVPSNAMDCPHCGRIFSAVKCPKCGFSGEEVLFLDGCPKCGHGYKSNGQNSHVDRYDKEKKSISSKWARRLILPTLVLLLVLLIMLWRQL